MPSPDKKHDGIRRWAIRYKPGCDFISDGVTMADAVAHFEKAHPGETYAYIRQMKDDEWLG